LLAAAACQISCQSDTQIWRYSYLNFSHIWLEMSIQAPKNEGFGGLWTPKCDYSSSRPPKGTSLRKFASFKLSTVKIRWGVWPVGELTESVTDRQTHTLSHTGKFIFCPCIALDRQLHAKCILCHCSGSFCWPANVVEMALKVGLIEKLPDRILRLPCD